MFLVVVVAKLSPSDVLASTAIVVMVKRSRLGLGLNVCLGRIATWRIFRNGVAIACTGPSQLSLI